jgi:hypothetical protein
MQNRMLRSVLVAAFSAVMALGVLAGLSGAGDDRYGAGGAEAAETVVVGETAQSFPADTVWD